MKYKIFVDGQEGTTGLKLNERLAQRNDLEILEIDPARRKDPEARRKLINAADIAFLCLPDSASRESVSLAEDRATKIIDASTAFRTDPGWTYGLPELDKKQRKKIRASHRISVPGCHATGFIMILFPLVKEGIVPDDYPVVCSSVAGYSGGGKKMIRDFEMQTGNDCKVPEYHSLGLNHKHLPEMQIITGLKYPPIFTPVVGNFYKGEIVTVTLYTRLLKKKVSPHEIQETLSSYYASEYFVRVLDSASFNGNDADYFSPLKCNDTNMIEFYISGNDDRILIMSRFDNLGKGSSGAAVQNMNIMLGIDEKSGLEQTC